MLTNHAITTRSFDATTMITDSDNIQLLNAETSNMFFALSGIKSGAEQTLDDVSRRGPQRRPRLTKV